jgi:hypothetical protein
MTVGSGEDWHTIEDFIKYHSIQLVKQS